MSIPLVALSGNNLDFGSSFMQGFQNARQMKLANLQDQELMREQQRQQTLADLQQRVLSGDQEAMNLYALQDPAGFKAYREATTAPAIELNDGQMKILNSAISQLDKGTTLEEKNRIYQSIKPLVSRVVPQLRDQFPEQLTEDDLFVLAGLKEQPEPLSAVAKIQDDLRRGLITPEQAAMAMQGEARGSGTSVNVNIPNFMDNRLGEKASEQFQKTDVDRIQVLRANADAASKTLQDVNEMRYLLEDTGYTGRGGEVVQAARTIPLVGSVLGGDSAAGEAFQSKTTEALSRFIAGTKGAVSDKEMATFQQASPSLSRTPEGNELIFKGMEAGALRVNAQAEFEEAWLNRYGNLVGSRSAWNKFINENPVYVKTKQGIQINEGNINNWNQYLSEGKRAEATAPATPSKATNYNVGDIYERGGVKYRFNGQGFEEIE